MNAQCGTASAKNNEYYDIKDKKSLKERFK